jgi:ABC-type Fe3+-citrate transport system substrate-binding protein
LNNFINSHIRREKKDDLEKEKQARRVELEQVKNQSQKKITKIVNKKILIETKLNEAENELATANQEIDVHERELMSDTCDTMHDFNSTNSTTSDVYNQMEICRTPSMASKASRKFINKLCSEKKQSSVKRII